MSALSDYVESGLLDHIFRGGSFPKPSYLSIALCSGTPLDNQSGVDMGELPQFYSDETTSTGYDRIQIGPPADSGLPLLPVPGLAPRPPVQVPPPTTSSSSASSASKRSSATDV